MASLNAKDQWHHWAVQTLSLIDEPVATSEIALAEACHLLKPHRLPLSRLVEAVEAGQVIPISPWTQSRRLIELIEKYPHMDAGDASLLLLSERFPKARLITTDVRDFTVYRRYRNEPLPLIHP